MGVFKNKENGPWLMQLRYTDWQGERKQKISESPHTSDNANRPDSRKHIS